MPHGFIAILCVDAVHFHWRQIDASTMIVAEVQAYEPAASKRPSAACAVPEFDAAYDADGRETGVRGMKSAIISGASGFWGGASHAAAQLLANQRQGYLELR